jgi:transcriptional regulator with XRE-family HTH domain
MAREASRATQPEPVSSPLVPAAAEVTVQGTLGARIRQERVAAGLTVRKLAARIAVSPSLISQIERGRAAPSVATLWAIASELGLPVGDLFSDAQAALGTTAPPLPVQPRGTRTSITLAGGVRWERLTPAADHEVDFIYVVYPVGSESCPPDALSQHGGKEYGYVISGRLGVQIAFDEYELRAGDSISFESHRPHRLRAIGDEAAVAVWTVVNRKGDERAALLRGESTPQP